MSYSTASASPYGDDADSTYTPDSLYEPEGFVTPSGKPKRKSTKGRTLQRWDVSKDQYVLLCVEYYIATQRIQFDWNEVAKLVAPTVTGEAVKQHLGKVRRAREDYNLEVPPPIGRDYRTGARKSSSSLIAPTKTGRRSQAAIEAENPFLDTTPAPTPASKTKSSHRNQQDDNTPDPKLRGLIYIPQAKERAPKIKTEGSSTPAPRKRKAVNDESTPTPTPKGRGKKQRALKSSFETGHETDHLRPQLEMGNCFSLPKAPQAKAYSKIPQAAESDEPFVGTLPPNFFTEVDGATVQDYNILPAIQHAAERDDFAFGANGLPMPQAPAAPSSLQGMMNSFSGDSGVSDGMESGVFVEGADAGGAAPEPLFGGDFELYPFEEDFGQWNEKDPLF